jgi:hypothetical protein
MMSAQQIVKFGFFCPIRIRGNLILKPYREGSNNEAIVAQTNPSLPDRARVAAVSSVSPSFVVPHLCAPFHVQRTPALRRNYKRPVPALQPTRHGSYQRGFRMKSTPMCCPRNERTSFCQIDIPCAENIRWPGGVLLGSLDGVNAG